VSSEYLTLEELLYALEHEGMEVQERTIRFWIAKGVLEKPLRKPFKFADGRVRYFPHKVVGEISDILRLQEEGWKLTQIKKRLRAPARATQKELPPAEQMAKIFLADFLGNGEFRDKQKQIDAADPSTPEWRKVRNFLVARLSHFVGRKQAVKSVTSFMLGLSKRDVAKLLRRTAGKGSDSEAQAIELKSLSPREKGQLSKLLPAFQKPEWTQPGPEPVLSLRLRQTLEELQQALEEKNDDGVGMLYRRLQRLHQEVRDSRDFLTTRPRG